MHDCFGRLTAKRFFFVFFFLLIYFFKPNTNKVIARAGPILNMYAGGPQDSLETQNRNRLGRKKIYLSICLYFSEGLFFFVSFFSHFFVFFLVARLNSQPASKNDGKPSAYLTLQSTVPLETPFVGREEMKFVFFLNGIFFFKKKTNV